MKYCGCKDCIFYDACDSHNVCDCFYPMDGEYDDRLVHRLVSENKKLFLSEWNTYINQYDD